MERYHASHKIEWLPLTVYGTSFLRFVFRKQGYELDEGIVLIADKEVQARQMILKYIQNAKNGCPVPAWKKRKKYPENYECGLLCVGKNHTEEEIGEYLLERDFLPIVISGGFLPEYLRETHYIFRVKATDLTFIASSEFSTDMTNFKEFVIKHIPEVCKCIEELDSSLAVESYDGEYEFKDIFTVFAGIAYVYALYLRQNSSERQVKEFVEDYIVELKRRLKQMGEFAAGHEIPELLTELVWKYIENHQEVEVLDEKHLDGRGWKVVQNQTAILYDNKFYYFPPKLFVQICSPLLQTMSEPELKRTLKSEGIIHCNSADYTVKKNLVNVFGVQERIRFLWVRKEKLLSEDNLYLENVFADNEEEEKWKQGNILEKL